MSVTMCAVDPSVGRVRARAFALGTALLVLLTLVFAGCGELRAQEPESRQGMEESPALQAPREDAGGASVRSDQPVPLHPEAEKAIGRLRSPFCPGFMLEVCPSPQAAALRDTLRMMAGEGITADSLVEWTLARYGEEWRALPRTEGTGLMAWVIPPVAILLGAVVVVLVLRRLRRGPEAYGGEEGPPEISPDEERRIEEALRELEREGR